MTPVTSVARVFEAIQTAKAGAGAFCTNFFPTQSKLQGWIDHRELFGEFRDHSAFFSRKDRDFWHLYFCASDVATLQRDIRELPALTTERVAVDLAHTGMMAAGTDWLAGRANTIPAFLAEILLYDPVFQRMKSNHSQPACRS